MKNVPTSGFWGTFTKSHTAGRIILCGLQSGAGADAPLFIRKVSTQAQFASAAGGDCDPFSASVYIEKAWRICSSM
jgi:hypothetical protein